MKYVGKKYDEGYGVESMKRLNKQWAGDVS